MGGWTLPASSGATLRYSGIVYLGCSVVIPGRSLQRRCDGAQGLCALWPRVRSVGSVNAPVAPTVSNHRLARRNGIGLVASIYSTVFPFGHCSRSGVKIRDPPEVESDPNFNDQSTGPRSNAGSIKLSVCNEGASKYGQWETQCAVGSIINGNGLTIYDRQLFSLKYTVWDVRNGVARKWYVKRSE